MAEESLINIREHIKNNSSKWDDDEDNIKNDAINDKLTVQTCLNPTEISEYENNKML